ncbi:MAG: hypothetical protein ABIW47_12575 [Ginsengibacter sp.]|jgi:hypothetical protein
MKKVSLLMTLFSFCLVSFAQQNLEGAWILREGENNIVLLLKDGYFTFTEYSNHTFINSWGGPFTVSGNNIKIKKEFDAQHNEETGTVMQLSFSDKNGQLTIKTENHSTVYTRLDDGKAPLAGVWKITGREQDGKLIDIHQTGPRKTLKMLTGGWFQWFAINPETKQFSGTGGGSYTFEDGKYTENILFFSRDSSRIGAKLEFDGKLVDGKWHHSGLSSKGDKIYEVWGRLRS